MKLPLQITYHGMEPSEALSENIRQKIEGLEKYYSPIMACRVAVRAHHRQVQGNIYHVRIDVTVAGHELVVSRDPAKNHAHEDAYVAVRDAFVAMRRQLQSLADQQQGKRKLHETPLHGRIDTLNTQDDCGRITMPDGREVYFHRNSVVNADFEHLAVGDEVRFDEEVGELGPQASTVKVIGKHHIV